MACGAHAQERALLIVVELFGLAILDDVVETGATDCDTRQAGGTCNSGACHGPPPRLTHSVHTRPTRISRSVQQLVRLVMTPRSRQPMHSHSIVTVARIVTPSVDRTGDGAPDWRSAVG